MSIASCFSIAMRGMRPSGLTLIGSCRKALSDSSEYLALRSGNGTEACVNSESFGAPPSGTKALSGAWQATQPSEW